MILNIPLVTEILSFWKTDVSDDPAKNKTFHHPFQISFSAPRHGREAQIKMSIYSLNSVCSELRTKDTVLGFMWPISISWEEKKKKQESICFCIGLSSFDFLKYSPELLHLHKGQFLLV